MLIPGVVDGRLHRPARPYARRHVIQTMIQPLYITWLMQAGSPHHNWSCCSSEPGGKAWNSTEGIPFVHDIGIYSLPKYYSSIWLYPALSDDEEGISMTDE